MPRFLIRWAFVTVIICAMIMNKDQLLATVRSVNTPKEAGILISCGIFLFLVLVRLVFGPGSVKRLLERTVSSFFIDFIKLVVRRTVYIALPGARKTVQYLVLLLSKLIKR